MMLPEPVERDEVEIAAALVERIGAGDDSAEAELIQRYSRGLLFFLRSQCGDTALADDIHQETFRVVLLRLRQDGLDDPGRLVGFLRRTARNLFLGEYRKTARRKTDGDEASLDAAPDRAPDPLRQALIREEAGFVRRLIHELRSTRDRQLLFRYYVAEEDKGQICAELDLGQRHFDRVLFRAKQRFKELVERFEKRQRLARTG